MSFNNSHKDAIAAYLGYAITAEHQSLISAACTTLESLSSDAETRVKDYLTTIAALDTEIATARLTVGSALGQLQTQGRRFISLVAIALNLEIRSDYYSGRS
jgi:hypothetical protein